MGWQQIHDAVRARFAAEVAAVHSIPTQYDNAPFSQPEGTIWVRWTVLPGASFQADVGSATRRHRTPGVAVAQIFSPLEKGDKDALVAADRIAAAFRGVKAGGVLYRAPSLVVVGRSEEVYQVNVNCPFEADEIY